MTYVVHFRVTFYRSFVRSFVSTWAVRWTGQPRHCLLLQDSSNLQMTRLFTLDVNYHRSKSRCLAAERAEPSILSTVFEEGKIPLQTPDQHQHHRPLRLWSAAGVSDQLSPFRFINSLTAAATAASVISMGNCCKLLKKSRKYQ